MADTGAIPAEAMEVLVRVNTGMVIDALAMSGIQGGIIGIHPVRGFEDEKIIGRAATAQYAPPRADTLKMSSYGVVRDTAPGSILMVDADGQAGHFVGDNVAWCAKRQGLAGIVVNGGVRDVVGLREANLPIYSTGLAVRQPSNMLLSAQGVPVTIGGVLIKPGDVVMCDEDGVVVIPAASLDAVIENMKVMFEVEDGMARAIQADAPVEEIVAILSRKKKK